MLQQAVLRPAGNALVDDQQIGTAAAKHEDGFVAGADRGDGAEAGAAQPAGNGLCLLRLRADDNDRGGSR